ncbi:unnamed protein product [Linum trigynum]|uniref:KIB1-4 beta-propeller domain-containing protein n=1 Tax=Linum trigynum TaxID=586398 RepID=A0AAV2DCJ5_9ROSI
MTGRSWIGLSDGWLLTWIPGSDANLIHPFTGFKIDLPPLSRCIDDNDSVSPEDRFIAKAVVTGSPWIDGCVNPNCVVVVALVGWNSALWSCKLADLVVDGDGNKMEKVKVPLERGGSDEVCIRRHCLSQGECLCYELDWENLPH